MSVRNGLQDDNLARRDVKIEVLGYAVESTHNGFDHVLWADQVLEWFGFGEQQHQYWCGVAATDWI